MAMRRLKAIRVASHMLVKILGEGLQAWEVVEAPLPRDARIVEARFDWDAGAVRLLVESESFEPVAEGMIIPEIQPVIRAW